MIVRTSIPGISSIFTRCLPRRSSAPLLLLSPILAASLIAAAEPKKLTAIQRLEAAHLDALHRQRVQWSRDRINIPIDGVYRDYRTVIHVHAEDAPHTKGTREEVLRGAKDAGVDAVLWTDHKGPNPQSWIGLRERVLFIPGAEREHELVFPSPLGELKFLSHLEEIPNALADGYNGMEIYNRHTDAELHKEVYEYIEQARKKRRSWSSLVSRFKEYPDEVFAAGADPLPQFLSKWDEITRARPFTGIAANDAHQNQIFDGVTFDPYAVAFRNVSTHVLARDLTDAEIRKSLRDGHAYVAHDWLCDPAGFQMVVTNALGVYDIGDPAPLVPNTKIEGRLPVPAKIRVIHNGAVVNEASGSRFTYEPKEEGSYRVEAWLTADGEDRPWIYTNPFYFHKLAPDEMRLPSPELSPGVVATKDIVYTEGKPADANKHKLDVYMPEGKTGAPVLFFVHGGSWSQGDRAMYPALGNRFAKAGYVVVIPSYRLMPGSAWPAQIEDVAAAFAWAHEYISKYGGDPAKMIAAGHSAGGHLVSLLALDPKWLANYKLPQSAIRGVISLSGVYDVSGLDRFGDPAVRKSASPIQFVRPSSPPFLVGYCQWDYYGLPGQARRFDADLRKAFVPATLLYVPGENHISEMIHTVNADDPTTRAMLEFMQSVLAAPAK